MNSEKLNDLSKKIESPVPFWFLNGSIDEWHIIREFEMMAEKGVTEVIVHPRYGLEVEYLSDGWFEIFGWCVREAKKNNIHIWIYDELNWPSGTAGMSVMNANTDFQGKYLSVEQVRLSEIDFESFSPGKYVIAANIEGESVTKTRLMEDVESIKALTGDWCIFNCSIKYDPFYVDTLSWEAINCFKSVTYDAYYERFGDEFGKTIQAVFTDEPSVYWVSVGYDDWNLPYTGDFSETFKARYGYEAAPMIPYLFYPGREGMRFRADYWEHAGYLFNERYHSNLGGWCREHNIIYTGHNNHEEPLRYQIRFQGDMFGTMRTMDIPGVDHLCKQTLGNSWISIIGHKICSSQAHVSGKARCMSESFGCMEWDTTYTNLKRVADWQYALGINLIIPHAIFHTISGMTKRESPPSFFYQSPHWEDFDYFSQYLKRMDSMLCGGRHLCKVAVMYPLSGLWATYQSDRKTIDFEHIDNFLNSLCLELVTNHIDFDLVDFNSLNQAAIDNGEIKLANERYTTLIVPSTPYLRTHEAQLLTNIVKSGVDTTFFHKAMEPIKNNLPEALRGANFVRSEELVSFVDRLRKQLDEDIQISGGGADDIMVYCREKDGRKITFLLNRSEKHRKVTAMLKNYPDAAIYDQETGKYSKLHGRQTGRKFQSQLRFQPNQSYFIVSNMPDAPFVNDVSGEPVPIQVNNLSVSVPTNIASIYHFLYNKSGEESTEVDVRVNQRYIPPNWAPEAPDWKEWAGSYEADVEINSSTDGIKLMLDKDYLECQVYVNGVHIELEPCCVDASSCSITSDIISEHQFLTDFQDVQADISSLLRQGKNNFKIISPVKLSEPLRIAGNFHVNMKGKSIFINPPDNVNIFRLELDYPFFSGTVTYKAEFEVDKLYQSLMLNLHNVRDSASIYINGKFIGKRLWDPFIMDIAGFVQKGNNTLEVKVRNNMANLIYGSPRTLGLQNIPSLSGFE